jgi:hypothetical protein
MQLFTWKLTKIINKKNNKKNMDKYWSNVIGWALLTTSHVVNQVWPYGSSF